MSRYQYQIKNFPMDNDSLMLNETLFHNANGYLGVRSNFEEGYSEGYNSIRGEYLNGFYDFAHMNQAEKLYGLFEEKQTMLNVVDTQGIKLLLDGEEFSMFTGTIEECVRTLDMEKGITIREVTWESPKGKRVKIEIKRMTSFNILPLFFVTYKVTPLNFSGQITLISTHIGEVMNYCNPEDPRVAGESSKYLIPVEASIANDSSYVLAKTSKSELSVCSVVKNKMSKDVEKTTTQDAFTITETIQVTIEEAEEVSLYKYTVICDSVRYDKPLEAAKEKMQEAVDSSLEKLYLDQETYLKAFWNNCDIQVYGDEDLNAAIRYNLYQLIQSVGKDPHSNIAAKGLSGEGYEGHYFWDTEMYMQPFFTLTAREIAQNLIRYRYTTLGYAKENAQIMGHKRGALYPWRTIMGKECSGYYVSGSAAYHISGDVAYAIISYYLATKDLALMEECGAEILIETARLWIDAGNYHNGKFMINGVTGPDEYTCLVNNNYYTNAVAKYNLKWAAKTYELLKNASKESELRQKLQLTDEEIAEFAKASESMYLPYDEELKINPQDDSFLQKKRWDIATIPEDKKPLLLHYHPMYLYRHQICKQADTVMAHVILEEEQSIDTMRNSFAYYEKVTTHDSSLSTCMFSIAASKLGLDDKAYEYFGESAKLDLFNTHKNTKDGIHTANMSGTYMAIVYGFGGLRIKESGLYLSPRLPKAWEGYQFRIQYEDAKINVEMKKEKCTIILLQGTAKEIHVNGQKYRLTDKIEIQEKKKSMKYEGVIFDLDGVICHTDKYHYKAWKALADNLGIYFDEAINNRLRGVSRMDSLEIILERYDGTMTDEEKVQYATKKNDMYKELLKEMSPADLSDEVKNTLDRLREKGLQLAIGSSSKNARFILSQIGLNEYFDAISDGNNISKSKPNPEVFVKAAGFINLTPAACLVVEDAEAGLEAAFAGGMDCAAIGDAVKCNRASYNLIGFADLLKVVEC